MAVVVWLRILSLFAGTYRVDSHVINALFYNEKCLNLFPVTDVTTLLVIFVTQLCCDGVVWVWWREWRVLWVSQWLFVGGG